MDLKKFAQKMFELSDWPDGGDIDAFDFQEAAVECGLLVPETRYKPCEDNCHCAEYYSDMSKGVTCYRKEAFLLSPDDLRKENKQLQAELKAANEDHRRYETTISILEEHAKQCVRDRAAGLKAHPCTFCDALDTLSEGRPRSS